MKRLFRPIAQLGAIACLAYLFLRQDFATVRPYFTWLGGLDPLLGLAGALKASWFVAGVSLFALALAAWRGRVFCGWVCPVGVVLDLCGALKRLVRWKDWLPDGRAQRLWNMLRWVLFIGVLGLTLLGWLGALSFNPLVLWPRAVRQAVNGSIPWGLAAVVLVGLVSFPRFWCRFICPAGSVLGLAARLRPRVRAAGPACRHCQLCRRRCPMRNIDAEMRFGDDCFDCGLCARICPAKCPTRRETRVRTHDEGRRDFLVAAGAGFGVLAMGTLGFELPEPAASTRWPRLLRPPGALRERELAEACTRCGQCLQVCPSKCLVPAGLEAGLAGLWTPRFVPRRGRCMFCMACGRVCPTRALVPVPLEAVRLGTARIDQRICLAWSQGIKCLLCVETCPRFAITFGPEQRPILDSGKCIGCGACEANCPVEGSAVILTCAGEIRRR